VGLAPLTLPVAANADTHTFIEQQILFPTGGAGEVGPANHFPSTISVSGVPGTVTKATVTLLAGRLSVPDDDDIVITGPNGQSVMLMGDTCGLDSMQSVDLTFDDAAQTFVPDNGPCPQFAELSFKPSNYLGNAPEPDDLSADGGPAGPFLNALSFLAGSSANGGWKLWALDDNASNGAGFNLNGWSLTLDVQPPPAAPAGAATTRKCKKKRSAATAKKKCRRKKKR
jgi:hypothetical protein